MSELFDKEVIAQKESLKKITRVYAAPTNPRDQQFLDTIP